MREDELTELHFHRVLVAIDGSAGSDLALSAAITLARRDNAQITLVAVEPDKTASIASWSANAASVNLQDEAHQAIRRTLQSAVSRMPDDVAVTTIHRFGKPGPEIVSQAESENYDAIIVGARGVGRVGSMLGSVSQHVLHYARTAVLVIHSPEP